MPVIKQGVQRIVNRQAPPIGVTGHKKGKIRAYALMHVSGAPAGLPPANPATLP